MYLPKEAYVRINFLEEDAKTKEEVLHRFGEVQKIDISKYVDANQESVSFMFKPDQSQLAEIPNLPVLVKIDAELTVRPSESEITTSMEYVDKSEADYEAEALEKAFTLAVNNFKGEDPILKACQEFPELKDQTDRDVALDMLERDTELRKKVCEKHQIIRYVLEGLGFQFPADEEIHVKDPENTQVWTQFEPQFNRVQEAIAKQEESIEVTMAQVEQSSQDISRLGAEYLEFKKKEDALKKAQSAGHRDPIYDDYNYY